MNQSIRAILLAGVLTSSQFMLVVSADIFVASVGAQAEEIKWRTGKAVRRQLEQPVSLEWTDVPLREALSRLSLSDGVRIAMLLDRRVDPGQRISIRVQNRTLHEATRAIATEAKIGACLVGDVIYFGPRETTDRLATVVELRRRDVARLPSSKRKAFSRVSKASWPDFITPRALVDEMQRKSRFTILKAEDIPHDLWAAANLPPMSVTRRLSLVVAAYDLTFAIEENGKTVRLVPMPTDVAIERRYPRKKIAWDEIRKMAEAFPKAKLRETGNMIVVTGRMEIHDRITVLIDAKIQATKKVGPGKKVYSLKVTEQPIGVLLKMLGPKLGLQVDFDSGAIQKAGISLDQRVSFEVKNASLQKLIRSAVADTGLDFRLERKKLHIRAAR